MKRSRMQTMAKNAAEITARVAILGISTQILLGIFWILRNFTSFQELRESFFFLKLQESMVCDEYVGILYPFIMRMATKMELVTSLPAHSLLYALQLMIAGSAVWYFWNCIPAVKQKSFYVKLWLTLAMVTFPSAAQCHLAVLPNSLTASLYLVSVGILFQKEGKPGVKITKLGILWLAETLLMPEYYLFGGILMMILVIRVLPKAFYGILIAAVFCAGIPVILGWTSQEGALGRMRQTAQAAAMRRLAWNSYGDFYPSWPKELREALTQEEIKEIMDYPEQAVWVLGNAVDEKLGKQKAREIYGTVAKEALRIRFRENVKDMIIDALCYGFVPASRHVLLTGKGDHFTLERVNYEAMRAVAPKLTAVYVRFDGYCFWGCLLIGFCWQIVILVKSKNGARKGVILRMLICGTVMGIIISYYVFQAGGCMDEKKCLPVTMFWMAWFCQLVIKTLDVKEQKTESGT